jgi:hypothetical protein
LLDRVHEAGRRDIAILSLFISSAR